MRNLKGRPRARAGPDRAAAPRTGRGRRARLVHARGGFPSSPTAAAVRWSAVSSRGSTGRRSQWTSSAMSAVLEIDRRQPGRADPGRGARAVDRGPVAPARSDVAAFPAVLRLLQSRRLAGHPRRWSLRHPLHPHRRPDRVVAGGHPVRDQRVAPAARIRRRPVAGPAFRRLRGHARHHHRGVDAVAEPPAMAGHGFGGVRRLGRRGRGDAGDRTVRALPGELPLAGPGRGVPERRHHGRRRAAGARFRIGRPSRSTRGWTGPSRSPPSTAAP